MGLSRRAYAEHRGVSESAVRKALQAGRISLEPDGTIDPAKADKQWGANSDPAQPKKAGGKKKKAAAQKAVPRAAVEAIKETLGSEPGEADAEPPGAAPQGDMTFLRARTANEVMKAQTAKVRLQKLNGELIDRQKAVAKVFAMARQERDAWLNWPARVAALMAAELGVPPQKMETALDKFVREHLEELGEVKVGLR